MSGLTIASSICFRKHSGTERIFLDKTDWLVFNWFMNKNLGKKKQPQIVRSLLLEAAAKVAVERGLAGLTLDLVAQKAGVSKGGLIHHYPSKAALINGLFDQLLLYFEKEIEDFILKDNIKSNKFTRAYINVSTNYYNVLYEKQLLGIFSLIMTTDIKLSNKWKHWLQQQLKKYEEDENSVLLSVARYAADGIWLEDCSGVGATNSVGRSAVIEHLIGLTN
ncbi:MAG: TetR/AcrR family transcriptional regulator [Deltaproteobacteria bacterium]|nr:TetR/AcrR family transcriptional regulator [Deltaproteobacteria bacterium]